MSATWTPPRNWSEPIDFILSWIKDKKWKDNSRATNHCCDVCINCSQTPWIFFYIDMYFLRENQINVSFLLLTFTPETFQSCRTIRVFELNGVRRSHGVDNSTFFQILSWMWTHFGDQMGWKGSKRMGEDLGSCKIVLDSLTVSAFRSIEMSKSNLKWLPVWRELKVEKNFKNIWGR